MRHSRTPSPRDRPSRRRGARPRHDRRARPPRPRRRRLSHRAPRRARRAAPAHHRPRDRRPADRQRGRHGLGHPERRDLQLRRAARGAHRAGPRFRTGCDTEVIAHQYEQDGIGCVRRFRGMFAFAVWDARRGELMVARDRFGIKPLFVAEAAGRMAFASEIKSLLHLPWLDRDWDARRCAPTCARLRALPPHRLPRRAQDATRHRRALAPRRRRPGGRPTRGRCGTGARGPASARRPLVRRGPRRDHSSCSRRASGSICAATCRSAHSCRAASIPDGRGAHARRRARATSRRSRSASRTIRQASCPTRSASPAIWATDHHTEIVAASEARLLPELLARFDEPFADVSAIPTYLVSRLARGR